MFNKTMMEMKFRLITFAIVFLLLIIVLVVTRPIIGDMMSQFNLDSEQLKDMPDFFKNLMGEASQMSKMMEDDQYFLLTQWYAKNFGQFLPLFALIMAFPIFARETDKGTIFFLLAKKNRSQIFWGKALSGYFAVITMTALFCFIAPIAMMLAGYTVHFNSQLFSLIVQQLTGVTFFYFLFLVFSIIFNDQIKPVLAGIVLIIALPFLSLIEALSWLNPYPYILGESVINKSHFDGVYSLGLLAATALLILAGETIFKKKEF